MSDVKTLTDRMSELHTRNQVLIQEARAAGRDLSADEQEEIAANSASWEDSDRQLELIRDVDNKNMQMTASLGRDTTPEGPAPEEVPEPVQNNAPAPKERVRVQAGRGAPGARTVANGAFHLAQSNPAADSRMVRTGGFMGATGFADFILATRNAQQGIIDPRLANIRNQPATFGSEGVGADGGFAVPPDFRDVIINAINGEDSLLPRTTNLVSSVNSVTMPIDAIAPWDNTTGPIVNNTLEGAEKVPSKPDLQSFTATLHKLTMLVNMTDEVMEDAPMLNSWLGTVMPAKFSHQINELLVNGTGVNQAQGILTSGEKVSVAPEGGQAAATILFANIRKMRARMYGPWRRNSVWLVHQDLESELEAMQFVDGAASPVPVYLPAGGVSGAPYSTLYGRPVIPCQECQALGTEGDIVLWAPDRYIAITKTGGIKTDTSIHLYFNYDMTSFRFVMRLGGRTLLQAPIAQRNGGNTLSSVVTLADRP